MVEYERIRKLELLFGCLVSVTFWLAIGLIYLQRHGLTLAAAEPTPTVLLFLVPPASVTFGVFVHTVLRSIAGLVLILLMSVPIVLGVCYLLFFALLMFSPEPLYILTVLIWATIPGCTLVTIVLAGIFGNPDRHMR